jgi:hypothetical protein
MMKRSIRAAATAMILSSGLGPLGCTHTDRCLGEGPLETKYRNCVDTNWPERYNYAARQAVLAPFEQQAASGHFLHQTIWNWYFEPGTDRLTAGGMQKLDSLARTTPGPDTKIYLQTARDLVMTADNIDKFAAQRTELDAKRAAAIQRYMSTQPGPAVAYEIAVHDAAVPGLNATFAGNAFRSQGRGYVGGIAVVGGTNVTATGGGAVVVNNNTPPGGGGSPGGAQNPSNSTGGGN